MNNLSFYIDEIRKYPILKADEEADLARRWHENQDQDALDLLVGSHIRLVVKIASGFSRYGLPLDDLVASGNLGLMQGVMKFDPERGFRLSTYVIWWIRAAMQEHILRNWSLVRATKNASRKKLFFNLRKIKAQLDQIDGGDLTPEAVTQIAQELGVDERDVVDMNSHLSGADASLNAPRGPMSDGDWLETLTDDSADQEEHVLESDELRKRQALMQKALKNLNERERRILSERKLKEEPATLEVLSKEYGISRERVRQIEVRAFEKLQEAILQAAEACALSNSWAPAG